MSEPFGKVMTAFMVAGFFFQAEDGIRDIGVTGVQTCALPIWWVVADFVTKRMVESRLTAHVQNNIVGDWVRFTLNYNTGAAMNISLGDASRVVFTALALVMLAVIFGMYRRT